MKKLLIGNDIVPISEGYSMGTDSSTWEYIYSATKNINTSYNIYLLCLNRSGTVIFPGYFKIKYYNQSRNGTLIRDLMPCYRISDNVIGLYDKINDVFYTNSGTGTFIKGPNVN